MATIIGQQQQQSIQSQHQQQSQLFFQQHQQHQHQSHIPHSYNQHNYPQSSSPLGASQHQQHQQQQQTSKKRSPRRIGQESLGAAMGTVLNSKSPNLAAKMNAIQYMDMSPLPKTSSSITNMSMSTSIILQETPSKQKRQTGIEEEDEEDENLPPGSAMKIDSPYTTTTNNNTNQTILSQTTNKPMTRRKAGSLGRLFGTELSQYCNSNTNNGGSVLGSNTLPLLTNATKHASLGCVFGGGESESMNMMLRSGKSNTFVAPAIPTKMTVAEDMSISMDTSFGGIGDYSIEEASPSVQCRIRQQGQLMSTILSGTKKSQSQSPPNKSSTQQSGLPNIRLPPNFNLEGSPVIPKNGRPNLFRRPSKDDSSPLGYGKRFDSFAARNGQVTGSTMGFHLDSNNIAEGSPRSPSSASKRATADGGILAGNGFLSAPGMSGEQQQFMPDFGASEREGKILPCFNVKDDGLMRITADTLLDVLSGQYDSKMEGYQIIDCRFGYEFKGGHIEGAMNLSTMDQVKKQFLHIEPESSSSSSSSSSSEDEIMMNNQRQPLPQRTQSGKPDLHGNIKKKVLIFHCEFSLKRAPSSALALRQADRSLAHDYPNCHYPEVYILQGGYSGFFTRFGGQQCQPCAYIQMDDPKYLQFRSKELNGFRKQFSRHRSFTYGDSRQMVRSSETGLMMPPAAVQSGIQGSRGQQNSNQMSLSIKEEDSSFDQSGGSPSALQANALMARRKGLLRHATASCTLGSAPNLMTSGSSILGGGGTKTNSSLQQSPTLGVKPILTVGGGKPIPTCVGDLSFDDSCSIGDDSISFDGEGDGGGGGIGDSPCAIASLANNGGHSLHSRRLPALAPGPRPPMMPSYSTSTATSRLHIRAPRRTASSNSFINAIFSMDR